MSFSPVRPQRDHEQLDVLNMPNATLVAGFPAWLQLCSKTWSSGGGRTSQSSSLGETWAIGVNAYTMGNVLTAPNPKTPNCSTNTSGFDTLMMDGLSSYHPGGANILTADGSVKFLKDSTNQQTVWSLGSRDQGEVIDANEETGQKDRGNSDPDRSKCSQVAGEEFHSETVTQSGAGCPIEARACLSRSQVTGFSR